MNSAFQTYIDPARKAVTAIDQPGGISQHDKLVKQTQKWVATAFFEPMLKQMRESPFKSDLFDGGKAGETFAGMYDERLSERMVTNAGNKLVNSIVNRIAKNAYDKQMSTKKPNSEREGADRVQVVSKALRLSTISGASNVASHF